MVSKFSQIVYSVSPLPPSPIMFFNWFITLSRKRDFFTSVFTWWCPHPQYALSRETNLGEFYSNITQGKAISQSSNPIFCHTNTDKNTDTNTDMNIDTNTDKNTHTIQIQKQIKIQIQIQVQIQIQIWLQTLKQIHMKTIIQMKNNLTKIWLTLLCAEASTRQDESSSSRSTQRGGCKKLKVESS